MISPDKAVLALCKVAFDFGRVGGGGQVAPKEWADFLRVSKAMRKALAARIDVEAA